MNWRARPGSVAIVATIVAIIVIVGVVVKVGETQHAARSAATTTTVPISVNGQVPATLSSALQRLISAGAIRTSSVMSISSAFTGDVSSVESGNCEASSLVCQFQVDVSDGSTPSPKNAVQTSFVQIGKSIYIRQAASRNTSSRSWHFYTLPSSATPLDGSTSGQLMLMSPLFAFAEAFRGDARFTKIGQAKYHVELSQVQHGTIAKTSTSLPEWLRRAIVNHALQAGQLVVSVQSNGVVLVRFSDQFRERGKAFVFTLAGPVVPEASTIQIKPPVSH